jgi:hypothetical protein
MLVDTITVEIRLALQLSTVRDVPEKLLRQLKSETVLRFC